MMTEMRRRCAETRMPRESVEIASWKGQFECSRRRTAARREIQRGRPITRRPLLQKVPQSTEGALPRLNRCSVRNSRCSRTERSDLEFDSGPENREQRLRKRRHVRIRSKSVRSELTSKQTRERAAMQDDVGTCSLGWRRDNFSSIGIGREIAGMSELPLSVFADAISHGSLKLRELQ